MRRQSHQQSEENSWKSGYIPASSRRSKWGRRTGRPLSLQIRFGISFGIRQKQEKACRQPLRCSGRSWRTGERKGGRPDGTQAKALENLPPSGGGEKKEAVAMRYRKFKLAKEKKKAGWVLQAVYSIGELEAVLKSSARFEEILFTSLYRKVPRHNLRWREAQRARRRLCKGK